MMVLNIMAKLNAKKRRLSSVFATHVHDTTLLAVFFLDTQELVILKNLSSTAWFFLIAVSKSIVSFGVFATFFLLVSVCRDRSSL